MKDYIAKIIKKVLPGYNPTTERDDSSNVPLWVGGMDEATSERLREYFTRPEPWSTEDVERIVHSGLEEATE